MSEGKFWYITTGCDSSFVGAYLVPVKWLNLEENKIVKCAFLEDSNDSASAVASYLVKKGYLTDDIRDTVDFLEQFRIQNWEEKGRVLTYNPKKHNIVKMFHYTY